MELSIHTRYQDTMISLKNQSITEKIRLIDIEGTYLIQIFEMETISNRQISVYEQAFDSIGDVEEFFEDQLGIELPNEEKPQRYWRDHGYD